MMSEPVPDGVEINEIHDIELEKESKTLDVSAFFVPSISLFLFSFLSFFFFWF